MSKLYRNYINSSENVEKTYKLMHEHQNLSQIKEFTDVYDKLIDNLDGNTLNLWDWSMKLHNFIDESDPDNGLPQIYHAYQTAESLRRSWMKNDTELTDDLKIRILFTNKQWDHIPPEIKQMYNGYKTINSMYYYIKNWDWLPLLGFVHDLGKVLALTEFGSLPQYLVVGDTYPLGCPMHPGVIYSEKNYSNEKPYSCENDTNIGIYNKNIGLENVQMTWGHDEFLARVFVKKGHMLPYLPLEAIYVIRFHSFYAWHTPIDSVENSYFGYSYLANKKDWFMLPLLKMFQKSDLYSKTFNIPELDVIESKYRPLLQL